jgi:hypothetical protein
MTDCSAEAFFGIVLTVTTNLNVEDKFPTSMIGSEKQLIIYSVVIDAMTISAKVVSMLLLHPGAWLIEWQKRIGLSNDT